MSSEGPAKPKRYVDLWNTGELARRAEASTSLLASCSLCPHRCGVNRLAEELGICGIGSRAVVASAFAHYGEERPLVGSSGSGTIFFSGCNLKCIFCQNADISWERSGETVEDEELTALMLALQERGCHNINFVTPTHVVPAILRALVPAAASGLTLPLVYNTGGYDSLDVLRLLDGVIDIYMPDIKYADPGAAKLLSGAEDYPEMALRAVREMHRQVGNLVLDGKGVARRGLLVRHLVLPGGLAGSEKVFQFLGEEISTETYVNVMDQYRPAFRAQRVPGIARRVSAAEYGQAVEAAQTAGLHHFL